MVEQTQKTLRDFAGVRWIALVLLALAMLFGYIFMDVLSPLQDLLQIEKGWSPITYGHYASSETFLNVFVFFLIFAGVILDSIGVRYTAILSGAMMVIGGALNWYGVSDAFLGSAASRSMDHFMNLPLDWWNITPFFKGMPASAKMSAIGFSIFGCGVEMAGISVSRGIVKWFKGKEMALAMGTEMALARIGVAIVMLGSPIVATKMGHKISVERPVAFALLLMVIGLICFIVYSFLDKKLDAQTGEAEEKDDPFRFKDLGLIFSNKMFWLMALFCTFYYAAIFPFQKYAINMLQNNLNFTAEKASLVFFIFPLGAAAFTPILGNYVDRKGKGVTMLIYGSILMIICHLIFALLLPVTQSVFIAYLSIVLLGISFSLVPAAFWPSLPKIVESKVIGSVYAVSYWIQNIGLYAFPMVIGSVLSASNPGVTDPLKYNYTAPMLVFAFLGVLSLILGFDIKAHDRKNHYGLEEPNIQK